MKPGLHPGQTAEVEVIVNEDMLASFEGGDTAEAARVHCGIFPLMKALFLETNPGPIKHALARRGLIEEEFRLPLVPVSEKTAVELDRTLDAVAAFLGERGRS